MADDDRPKKCSNVTVDQIIEHMTADLTTSDGQYIQLGFTPPPTPNDNVWPEYMHHSRSNVFLSPYATTYAPPPNPNFGYSADPFLTNGYIAYDHRTAAERYFSAYADGRDYTVRQEASPRRTQPLIENLVGNWTPNTSGTYSPFGNGRSSAPNPYDDTRRDDINTVDSDRIGSVDLDGRSIRKRRIVAEVKPMRPSYSDVLTKSAPTPNGTTLKTSGIEPISESKSERRSAGLGKNTKIEKSRSATLNVTDGRRSSSGELDTEVSASPRRTVKSSRGRDRTSYDTPAPEKRSTLNERRRERTTESTKQSYSRTIIQNCDEDDDDDYEDEIIDGGDGPSNSESPDVDDAGETLISGRTETSTYENRDEDETGDGNVTRDTKRTEEVRRVRRRRRRVIDTDTATVKDARPSTSGRTRPSDRNGSGNEPSGTGRRDRRGRKREGRTAFGNVRRIARLHLQRSLKIAAAIIVWFLGLIVDVLGLSVQLARDLGATTWEASRKNARDAFRSIGTALSSVDRFKRAARYFDETIGRRRWAFWKSRDDRTHDTRREHVRPPPAATRTRDTTMPSTGDEAMKRLLACEGEDPYSILGVSPDCDDEDIKRHYKRQAFLVHPDKNAQPGAEEAFKILVHAFDMIGEPERRRSYDRKVAESHQVERAWTELNDLLSRLHAKMEYAANTIRCANCSKRHRRTRVDRPCYAARSCAQCGIRHAAREGDVWAEASRFGLIWHYYACIDGGVYDVTEWAGCQRGDLRRLRPDAHVVQYRIVLGRREDPAGVPRRRRRFGPRDGAGDREPDLDEFLDDLYGRPGGGTDPDSRTDPTRGRKKNKKKK